MIRPERLRLHGAAHASDNVLDMMIDEVINYGDLILVIGRTHGLPLRARIVGSNPDALMRGVSISLGLGARGRAHPSSAVGASRAGISRSRLAMFPVHQVAKPCYETAMIARKRVLRTRRGFLRLAGASAATATWGRSSSRSARSRRRARST